MSFIRIGGVASAALFLFSFAVSAQETPTSENFGVGSVPAFVGAYEEFRADFLKSANPNLLIIPLGYDKGLSSAFEGNIVGTATIDLVTGATTVELKSSGVQTAEQFGVWLLERDASDSTSDAGNRQLKLGNTSASSSTAARLSTNITAVAAADFTFDRVVVGRGGDTVQEILVSGSVSVLQKIFFRRLSLLDETSGKTLFAETTAPPPLARHIPDLIVELEQASDDKGAAGVRASVAANLSGGGSMHANRLVSQGARLFFENTFNGNGRTCGTCHPKENNFQIDPAFISTRPANDPLFVAEFNSALAQLERPVLMRAFGLILENLDGFADPTRKFVMRGVPHTLGMRVSLKRDTTLTNPPAPRHMTGWSGDGAPGAGSLRDFATGAVRQHFTKSLRRIRNVDFRLPNEHQLDALEAFQLSVGRSTDPSLTATVFRDAAVENGKLLFVNGTGDPNAGGRCAACHSNGGALIAPGGENRNFNTNVENVPHPGRSIEPFPIDGGFGQGLNPEGTFGNKTFNTATVIEAADTPPFFHNNVVSTLEGVVEFYTGPEFNGPLPPAFRIAFTKPQATNVVQFMRGINTLQNIDVSKRELQEILSFQGNPQNEITTRLNTAVEDIGDAIVVLNQGSLYPSAVTALNSAWSLVLQAKLASPSQRTLLIQQAITQLNAARGIIAV